METDKQRKRKGFFKTLVTILLGTRKEYKVEDLGVFSGKVCDWWQNDHYNRYHPSTAILFSGNGHCNGWQCFSAVITTIIRITGITEKLGIHNCPIRQYIAK